MNSKFAVKSIGITIWMNVCSLWRYWRRKFFQIKRQNLSILLMFRRSDSGFSITFRSSIWLLSITNNLSECTEVDNEYWPLSIILSVLGTVNSIQRTKSARNHWKITTYSGIFFVRELKSIETISFCWLFKLRNEKKITTEKKIENCGVVVDDDRRHQYCWYIDSIVLWMTHHLRLDRLDSVFN